VSRKWRSLLFLSLAALFAMALWFSASAVVPQLASEWSLDDGQKSWLTMSVQVGFVAGALVSALLNLADRLSARSLFAASAVAGAAFNALIPWLDPGVAGTLALRFLTGVTLAGVYPPGMKLVATWCREDRGLGIGILVGALTIGSASPHLLNAAAAGGMPPWRTVLLASSGLAALAAAIGWLLVEPGPHPLPAARFDWRHAGRALSDPPTRLANFGYLGHMWELYAVWAWAPLFVLASYDAAGWSARAARVAGFAVIAVGAVGCVVAGVLADRFGRTTVAAASLAASGACCLVAGSAFGSPALLTAICLVWGVAVVADSAQFSAAVSELADPRYVGTALTVQTSLGFLLTLATIRLVPFIVETTGWERAFWVLAPGPAFGIWSLARLRRRPEASRLASGNR